MIVAAERTIELHEMFGNSVLYRHHEGVFANGHALSERADTA